MDKDTLQLVRNIKRMLVYMAALIIFGFGAAYTAGYAKTAWGLLVGLLTGGLYFLLMSYRIYKSAKLPKNKAIAYMRTGWWVRLSFIVLALVFSVHFAQINFWGVVAGLLSLHVVIVINALVVALGDYKQ